MHIVDALTRIWQADKSQYSPLIHLARSIRLMGAVRIAMFTAYIDESGTDEASNCLGIGGLIADAEQWTAFETQWRQALADAGVKYSHMKEYAHSTGEFGKWKSKTKQFEPQRERFMRQLCYAITKTAKYTFGAIITRGDYEKFVPEDLRRGMGTPYTFLGRYCIARVGVWAQENSPKEPVKLVFERGQPSQGLRLQHGILSANEVARKQYKLGLLTFADKYVRDNPEQSVLPLQAADIVAYELVKQWRTMQKEATRLVQPYILQDSRRYPLKRLMELPRDWNILTAANIAEEVRVWQTAKNYAKAFNAELPSNQCRLLSVSRIPDV
ncbi:MAG: DUF3800 domain-containing protein [Rhizomicrobium sp.]